VQDCSQSSLISLALIPLDDTARHAPGCIRPVASDWSISEPHHRAAPLIWYGRFSVGLVCHAEAVRSGRAGSSGDNV